MKTDRRWFNDGRLERELQAERDRDKAPAAVVQEYALRTWLSPELPYRLLSYQEFTDRYEVEVHGWSPPLIGPVQEWPDGPDGYQYRIGVGCRVSVTPRNARLRVWLDD